MSTFKNSNHAVPHQMRKVFGPNIYRGMAEKLFPAGSILRCKQCVIERHCTTQEIEGFLRDGYPTCKRCNQKTSMDNPHVKKIEF